MSPNSIASKLMEKDFENAIRSMEHPTAGPLPGCDAAHARYDNAHKIELMATQEIIKKLDDVHIAVKEPEIKAWGIPVSFLINWVKVIVLCIIAASGIIGLIVGIKTINKNQEATEMMHKEALSLRASLDQASSRADQASDKAADAAVTVASTLKKTGGQKQ